MNTPHPFYDNSQIKTGRFIANVLKRTLKNKGACAYSAISGFIPGHGALNIHYPEAGICVITAQGITTHFPYLKGQDIPMPVAHMTSVGITRWLKEKYQMEGFVEVDEGDIVVDCGSFVGGFARGAAEKAKAVYAFEPSPSNHKALLKNIESFDNIKANAMGLYNETKTTTFNLSDTHVDDSLLTPDAGAGTGKSVEVQLMTMDDWAKSENIQQVDFMKLEAEGVENEVLEGIQNLPVKKFAIDCSPERDNISNMPELQAELEKRGYECRSRKYMLFAKKG